MTTEYRTFEIISANPDDPTHYELEQWDSARAALTQVQELYPDSTLSRLAENRLRSMRMEGHY